MVLADQHLLRLSEGGMYIYVIKHMFKDLICYVNQTEDPVSSQRTGISNLYYGKTINLY